MKNRISSSLACLFFSLAAVFQANAAPAPTGTASILPPHAKLELLWDGGEFTEGVAAAADGTIYFSDITSSPKTPGRILRFDPKTKKTTTHCADSGQSNGLMFDATGRLIACCGANNGKIALCEILPDGSVKMLVDRFKGKRLASPNDLVVHPSGAIYFSDPRYVGAEPVEVNQMSVYRYQPKTGKLQRVTREEQIQKPNGLHVSPDGKTLYVAETNNGSKNLPGEPKPDKPGRMTLNAFTIKPNGTLGAKRVLVDFGNETGVDGLSIDMKGNIYAAVRKPSRHGIVVFTPKGKEIAYIPTDELPTNCSFGRGSESKTLYVTAGNSLFRIRLNAEGFHPAAKQ